MKHRYFVSFAMLAAVLAAGIAHAQVTHNSISLSWTTPGDDGSIGTAAQFDLRYSTSPITETNFLSASRWSLTPTPGAAGTKQNVIVTGLQPLTTYYFAIKTGDESQNWSPISNVAQATTASAPDNTRPATLAITVSSVTDTTATLSWNAVGDDSLSGAATSYDVRYSTSPITATNWSAATQATGEPTPGAPGAPQSITIRNLSRQQTYYFAARVIDDVGNVSAISNVPSVTTPDTMAPAAIRDLAVGWLFMGWHAPSAKLNREQSAR
jgi:purple acid phosphatase-like protein/fibronectin type III domain protein